MLGIDHDADFAPGLNGVRLGDAVKAGGDIFQVFQTLDVVFKKLLARARPCAGNGVRGLHQHGKRACGAHILMMRGNGVDDFLALVVLLGEIRADERVRAFHFMIDGLADIMQQTGALGLFDVHTQFGGHHAAQGGDFQRMLKDVLGKGGAVTELPEQADQFGMNAVNARIERRLFADFADLRIQFLLALLHDVFNARGVNAPILNQAFQRHFGDLPPQGAVGRENDGFRGVVNDEINACGGFEGADIAAFAADDAPFHILAGQGDGGDGLFIDIVAGVTLDHIAEDILGLAIGGFARFRFNLPDHPGGFMARSGFDFGKKAGFGLFGREAGDFFEAAFLLVDAIFEEFLLLGNMAFLAGKVLFRGKEFMFLFGRLFELFLKAAAEFFELAFTRLDFALALLELVFHFALLVEKVILPLNQNFLFLRLRFLSRLLDYALGKLVGVAEALCRRPALHDSADQQASDKDADKQNNCRNIHISPSFIWGASPFHGRFHTETAVGGDSRRRTETPETAQKQDTDSRGAAGER